MSESLEFHAIFICNNPLISTHYCRSKTTINTHEARSAPDAPPLPPSSTAVKRKRPCDSVSNTTPAVAVTDSEGPSKRRRTSSGTSKKSCSEAEKAESGTTTRHPLSMSHEEIKRSVRRNEKTFGTVRKPRATRGASLRQRGMGTRS